jgi:hypothetical protein
MGARSWVWAMWRVCSARNVLDAVELDALWVSLGRQKPRGEHCLGILVREDDVALVGADALCPWRLACARAMGSAGEVGVFAISTSCRRVWFDRARKRALGVSLIHKRFLPVSVTRARVTSRAVATHRLACDRAALLR